MAVTQGIDKDIQEKLAAKYDYAAEGRAKVWIESVTGEKCPDGEQQFGPWLQDGMVLCKLVNCIKEMNGDTQGDARLAKIGKINDVAGKPDSAMVKSKRMENITNFIKAVRTAGVIEQSNFATISLLELKNLGQVLNAVTCYSEQLRNLGLFDGPFVEMVNKVETSF